jgi:Carboxypeptidase regulatory-like domain
MTDVKPKRRWFRFSIRDLLLAIVIAALASGWWFDHQRLTDKIDQISPLVQPAATIEGRVVYDESGQPAAGIRVYAQAIMQSPSQSIRNVSGVARTDDDGHYKFVDLAPGNWNIFVEAQGWTASAVDALPLIAGQAAKTADLRLVKGGFIKGRVVDDKGNPVSFSHGQRVTIGVYGPARPKSGSAIEGVYVDAKGEFRIRVPAGRNYPYLSSILPSETLEGNEFEQDGVMVEDGNTTEIEFRIQPSSGTLSGTRWPPVQPVESEPSDEYPPSAPAKPAASR